MALTQTNQLPTLTITHDILAAPTSTIYGPFRTPSEASGAQAVNRSSSQSVVLYVSTTLTLFRVYPVAALAFLIWDILITFDDEVSACMLSSASTGLMTPCR